MHVIQLQQFSTFTVVGFEFYTKYIIRISPNVAEEIKKMKKWGELKKGKFNKLKVPKGVLRINGKYTASSAVLRDKMLYDIFIHSDRNRGGSLKRWNEPFFTGFFSSRLFILFLPAEPSSFSFYATHLRKFTVLLSGVLCIIGIAVSSSVPKRQKLF